MMRKQSKQNSGRRPNRRTKGDNQLITHPPQLPTYGLTRDVRLRFVSNAAFAGAITFQNLLDTILVAITAIAGVDLFDAVKLRAVEVWAAGAVGTAATATVVFSGEVTGAQGDLKTHTDTSMGIEPAHVRARPDRLTQAGQFQVSAADIAFTLVVPANSVIDVSMSMRQPMLAQATAAQNALVGATPGAAYYRGLDGKTIALTVLPVVGAVATI
jgi:hypothetical protein